MTEEDKERWQRAAEQEKEWWLRRVAGQEEEWLRQSNLAYGGLIGVGIVMVQQFLTAPSLDLPARICVITFAVAIPLLAALVMVNRQEAFRRRATKSILVSITKAVAQSSAFAGIVAGFWHISWIAGVAVLASAILGMAVHSAGYVRLERDVGD
ncbi:MAG TPA: hypothetical protein VGR06_08900 [Actinophytocola sp.]|jgi:uncharacterized integral membrane protein|uniref:hypothetical protein n=1 Tax=Actinophytocola sp. TaxID=1872138 RepID=UPI002E092038|nr:hypothetical protein [Actinophytocola sp.]